MQEIQNVSIFSIVYIRYFVPLLKKFYQYFEKIIFKICILYDGPCQYLLTSNLKQDCVNIYKDNQEYENDYNFQIISRHGRIGSRNKNRVGIQQIILNINNYRKNNTNFFHFFQAYEVKMLQIYPYHATM